MGPVLSMSVNRTRRYNSGHIRDQCPILLSQSPPSKQRGGRGGVRGGGRGGGGGGGDHHSGRRVRALNHERACMHVRVRPVSVAQTG